ncbi:MAG: SusD/RagB family nutrient-binding outer membrane lipoprotein [Cellulophaga sp.]|uniref:SusD/RagB family nutrient-binding outer membrane lipoprotein n=2 Tax=Pseudomonadati TaxID=3379134 RepID=UPI0026E2EF87|nr:MULTISPECIES: SusD/RagB family nutrient-binding outer membrane lipoprotein [unclassified Cellulophaga]MDO6490549.1 SusD/RagB family nutrient-binding outer membrane lipoprotein [Cellulophaga sp. 2_MG-2023]MDO6494257.1 SusD/RagB family nutrient-binding outer membrane lipoprotein [Cellulophaga sp. 3_MG-2023]
MKKNIIIVLLALVTFSCTNDLEELNVNKKDFAQTTDASLFTSAQYKLFNQMTETSVNENIFRLIVQNWTETTYTDEANYDLKTRNIDEHHWETLYRDVLKNLKESKSLVSGSEDIKTNKTAIIELYEIYTYYVLVTSFGDIPYTEALDIEALNPVFDKQDVIFADLLNRLDENVISKIITDEVGFSASEDIVYHGDTEQWKKFANSLKLQMGMLIADSDPAKSETVVSQAVDSGVFTSSSDDMKIAFESAAPYTNPVYAALVLSGRDDYVPTNTIVNMMNSVNDPRRDDYFTLYKNEYKGGIPGELNTFGVYSHVSDKIGKDPTLEAPLMTYYEVEFLLAEAVERGFIAGDAETHYNNAVTASIKYWGGTDAEAITYLGETNVSYTSAAGDYKQKIGTQKWLALYNRGFESWTEWRRLDYPVLVAPEDAKTTNDLPPFRMTYPDVELTLNEVNLKAAITSIGGDELETKLFWDKN